MVPAKCNLDFLGFPNYDVLSSGHVRNCKTQRVLKTYFHKGYQYLQLYSNGKDTNFDIHRLVALAFVPNPNNLPEVNHKDGNKENCWDWNLEWVSHRSNIHHAYLTGLNRNVGETHHEAILTNTQVLQIREEVSNTTYSKLALKFGVSESTIDSIIARRNWNHI
jgi:hypothetical protein